MMEQRSNYWISLVRKLVQDLEVTDCLERHGVEVLGAGRMPLPAAGVDLHLRKSDGAPEDVWIAGVEFVVVPRRGAKTYAGDLPHGIIASDSMFDAGMKLNPAMLVPARDPNVYEAVFPEHRLLLKFDGAERMESCAWLTTRTEPEPLE